ncbi:MAG: hypothetical protein WCA63_06950 [Gallionella sp.]
MIKHLVTIMLVILAFSEMDSYANAVTSSAIGDISCKQWLDRKNKTADEDPYVSWLQGYLSGANAMYDDLLSKGFLNSTNKTSVSDWTNVYCQKYPNAMLHDSANALIKVLQQGMPYF